jgi:hypothetical protein
MLGSRILRDVAANLIDRAATPSPAAYCGGPSLPLKPLHASVEFLMVGIGIIVVFLIVIGGLNLFEFGRID